MSRYSTIIIFCHRNINMFRFCLVLKWTTIFDLTYWHIRSRWRFVYLKILIFFHSRTLFITNWRRLLHYQLFIKGMISEKKCCDPLCGWYAVVHEYRPLSKSPMNEGWGWGLDRWKASSKHLVTLRLLTFQYIFYWGKFFRVPYLNVSNPSVLIAFHMTDSINSPFISKASAIIPIQSHTDNNSMYMFHSIVPQSPG